MFRVRAEDNRRGAGREGWSLHDGMLMDGLSDHELSHSMLGWPSKQTICPNTSIISWYLVIYVHSKGKLGVERWTCASCICLLGQPSIWHGLTINPGLLAHPVVSGPMSPIPGLGLYGSGEARGEHSDHEKENRIKDYQETDIHSIDRIMLVDQVNCSRSAVRPPPGHPDLPRRELHGTAQRSLP